MHGFDEFFGNLYHLNAEEEPEKEDYPNEKDFPKFKQEVRTARVLHSWATDKDDPTDEPRWGKVGKQRMTDTGPLTKKRMETVDDEIYCGARNDFIKRRTTRRKPFFVWLELHAHASLDPSKARERGQAGRGQGAYHDRMIDARQEHRPGARRISTISASRTTPS